MELIRKSDALHGEPHEMTLKEKIEDVDRRMPTILRSICEKCRDYQYCQKRITLIDTLGKEQTDDDKR